MEIQENTILAKVNIEISETMHLLASDKDNDALKDKLKALRLIKSELIQTNNNADYILTNDEEEDILSSMKKKREKTIEIYVSKKRDELAKIEQSEIDVIQTFLPKEPIEEMKAFERELISRLVAEKGKDYKVSKKDMGYIIKRMREKYPKVEGNFVSATLNEITNG